MTILSTCYRFNYLIYNKDLSASNDLALCNCVICYRSCLFFTFILVSQNFPTFSGIWEVLTEVAEALQHVEGSVRRQWLMDAVEISCVSTYPSTVGTFITFLLF